MKGIDIFCSSQAATAICLSMEEAASSAAVLSSSSTLLLGGDGGGGSSDGRAIDRHNPIIRDSKRYISISLPPCINSQPPVSPKPRKALAHGKIKNDANNVPPPKKHDDDKKLGKSTTNTDKSNDGKIKSGVDVVRRRSWSCVKPSEFTSPASSTRYLLSNDKVLLNSLSDFEPAHKIFSEEKPKEAVKATEESCDSKPNSSYPSPDQVVVLRVLLDCRGCEKKMRKHISRMQGVTSFDIDFAAKKVTVTGKLTPSEVLSSISKVKKAQLLSPTAQHSQLNFSTGNASFNDSDVKNERKEAAVV